MLALALGAGAVSGLAAVAAASGSAGPQAHAACGTERWSVKTLTDPAAAQVNFTPRSTTIARLRKLARPAHPSARTPPVETTTYKVKARLVTFKLEDDQDIHLVVADPNTNGTMIVEFPNAACIRPAVPSAQKKMRAARQALLSACGTPSTSRFRTLHGAATISGVGFFDFKHHQRGLAPNAIELHPVVGFRGSCT